MLLTSVTRMGLMATYDSPIKEFRYLGSMTSDDARCHREIKRRIAMGKEAFYRRKELLRGGLKRCLKKRLVKTLIWSVTLYCAETWTLRKEDINRLKAFGMWIWRRMEKISWTQHISNDGSVKTGRRRKIPVNDNKNKTMEWDGAYNKRGIALKRN